MNCYLNTLMDNYFEIKEKLLQSIESNDLDCIDQILKINEDFLNTVCDNGDCIFLYCVKKNKYEIVKLLLEKGVTKFYDINTPDKDGIVLINLCAQNGFTQILQILIQQNDIILPKNNNEPEANNELVKLFETKNVTIDHFLQKTCVRLGRRGLLNYQKSNVTNDILLYMGSKHSEFIRMIINSGMSLTTNYGLALIIAAENGHLEIVKYLVKNKPDVKTFIPYTVKVAYANKHDDIVKYLLSYSYIID